MFLMVVEQGSAMFTLHWAPQIMWPLLADRLEVEHERAESRVALRSGLSTRRWRCCFLGGRRREEQVAGGERGGVRLESALNA